MKDGLYLKDELYKLVQSDISIFEFIQEGSLDGIWYWDLENPENEWMSPRFWEVMGYNPSEMKHLASEWQDIINQHDLQVAVENFSKHLEDPNHPYDQIVRYKHKDGSTVWIRCRGIAIRDKNNKPIRMLGAHNDLTTVMRAEHELNEKREVEELNRKLTVKVNEDYLTKLLNRRGLEEKLDYIIEAAKRSNTHISVAMFDIDFFKRVNDTYGHAEGDVVLMKVSNILIDASRSSDVVGRFGGEEFMVLMPRTNKEEAIIGAERIRLYIQNRSIGKTENLTISCGVSTIKVEQKDDVNRISKKLQHESDNALYYAKNNGRNSVVHFNDI